MTLDEAIDIFQEDVQETILNLSELRSGELVEWLKELRKLREKNRTVHIFQTTEGGEEVNDFQMQSLEKAMNDRKGHE